MSIHAASRPAARGGRARRWRSNLGAKLFLIVIVAFLVLPLAVVVLFSFNASSSLSFPMTGLSLRWYGRVLDDPEVTSAIGRSAIAALLTGLVAGGLGILAALGLQGLPPGRAA